MKLTINKDDDEFKKYISSDDALFHYTGRAVALEKILFNKSFKFSSLKNTNDPHEYKDKLVNAVGFNFEENKVYEIQKKINEFLTEQTWFVSCCANEFKGGSLTCHGCLKPRMWSQYGENHEGICLVFSKEKLLKLINNEFESKGYFVWERDIEYKEDIKQNSRHSLLNIDHNTFSDNNTPENVAIKHVEKYREKLLFRKQNDYQDEQEYRIVILRKDGDVSSATEPLFEIKDCLKGIILGDNFPEVYNPTIKSICNEMNISYKKLYWNWQSSKYFLRKIKTAPE